MSFNSGDTVLSKVKGFSPWPSMILPDELAPENILQIKPKSRAKRSKKSERDERIYLVKFFSDDTYRWVHGHELQPLPLDQVAKVKPKRPSKQLAQAYKIAAKELNMYDFASYGSSGKPKEVKEPVEVQKSGRKGKKRRSDAKETKNLAKKRKIVDEESEEDFVEIDDEYEEEEEEEEEEESDEIEELEEFGEEEDDEEDDEIEEVEEAELDVELDAEDQQSIDELEKQYKELIDDSFWGGLGEEDVAKSTDPKKWNEVVQKQAAFILGVKRILIKQALKSKEEVELDAVEKACEKLLSHQGKIYNSSLNKVNFSSVLVGLLKRSDLKEVGNWSTIRDILVRVFEVCYPDCTVPLMEDSFIVGEKNNAEDDVKKEEVKKEIAV